MERERGVGDVYSSLDRQTPHSGTGDLFETTTRGVKAVTGLGNGFISSKYIGCDMMAFKVASSTCGRW
ncbi:Hypothetical protein SMAX5B_011824 [Scophthalmus maximus]|uniref:Uncharacterized protein n=1 Tax=Scophthalmus maximus TaxID=52904 RepID=A0A2U9AYL8_SCOMX|nr:Hypothetical protein SMAX5B_011824 [Scophthalmus maximus]